MEYFDICDENGQPTGEIISREKAHEEGILHRTAHTWVIRQNGERTEILLQKRSDEKDSFPGLYDTSSAGHIPAGSEPLESALRELWEELGIQAEPQDLRFAGTFRIQYEKEFHGKMFRDNEAARVYVYEKPVDIEQLKLQESEVSEVRWFDLLTVAEELEERRDLYCIPAEGLQVLMDHLKKRENIGRLTEAAITYIKALFLDNAGGHDADHTLRVYHNALRIAANEPDCDQYITALAALLHDADDHKLFATDNNANTRNFLAEHLVEQETADRICEAINSVSFSQNRGQAPATLEGKIVQDADRLDAMGAIGIARTFAYGGEHGRSLRDSVQHFYDKLLLLKELMNTETGTKMAEKRHAFLETFLNELKEEAEAI